MIRYILLLLMFPLQAMASDNLVEIWENNQAVDFLSQDKRTEAHEEFTRLLSDKPNHPLYQFNTGVTFFGVEDVENSIKMFEELSKNPSSPPVIEYAALYNLGVLFATKSEIDKALSYYQKALEIKPESQEIKTNIELLFQQKNGKGKGKGDKDKDKEKDEKQDEDDSEGKEQPKEPQKFQNQPKQFNSKEMSKSDVKKILEELKKQEQRIRAKHERKGGKEADRDKNW